MADTEDKQAERAEDAAAQRADARKARSTESRPLGSKPGLGKKMPGADEPPASDQSDDPLSSLTDPRRTVWIGIAVGAIALLVVVAFALPAGQNRPTPAWAVWVIVAVAAVLGAYVFFAERRYIGLYGGATAKLLATGRSRIAESDAQALQEASSVLTAGLPLVETLDVILSAAVGLLEGNEGSIMLLDPDGKHLETVCYRGDPERYEPFARTVLGEGIAGHVAKTRKGVALSGPADPEKFEGLVDKKKPIDSSICVPLVKAGTLIGVLNVSDTAGGRGFDDSDLTTLQVFADDAAAAIVHSAGIS